MTKQEAKKAVKAAESDALGPARNTRSQARTTRPQPKKSGQEIFIGLQQHKPKNQGTKSLSAFNIRIHD
jgi:hypothetical protein